MELIDGGAAVRRLSAAVFLILGLGAVSCGAENSPDVIAESGDDTALEAPSAERLVLDAVSQTKSVATSVRADLDLTVRGIPEIQGDLSVAMTMAVAANGDAEMVMDMSSLLAIAAADSNIGALETGFLESMFGEPIEFRSVDGVTYVSASFMSFLMPSETKWVAFEDGLAGEMSFETQSLDPGSFLLLLEGIDDDAEVLGTEDINGVSTTHVRGLLSLAEAMEAAAPDERETLADQMSDLDPTGLLPMDAEIYELDVWVDDDGLIRRLRIGVSDLSSLDSSESMPTGMSMELAIDFSDYGADVEVEAPPSDEVTFLDGDSFLG